jgi:hypothetical protein
MPKLINRNPKFSKLKKYAVVYYCGKIHYLGLHGTPEALTAYNRFCAEIQSNPVFFLKSDTAGLLFRNLWPLFLTTQRQLCKPRTTPTIGLS